MTNNNFTRIKVPSFPVSVEDHAQMMPLLMILETANGTIAGNSTTKGFEKQHPLMSIDWSLSRLTDIKGASHHQISDEGFRIVLPADTAAKVGLLQALLLKEPVKKITINIVDVSNKIPTLLYYYELDTSLFTDFSVDTLLYLGSGIGVTFNADTITLNDAISKQSTKYSKSQQSAL